MVNMRVLIPILVLLLLVGCSFAPAGPEDTVPVTVADTLPPSPPPTTTEPIITGWVEENGLRFYYDLNGDPLTGWQEIDGLTYYFKETGAMATGEVEIEGIRYHFTSQGQRVILVNPWNFLPEDYAPDLVELLDPYGVEDSLADASCVEDLKAMIDAWNRECPEAIVVSSYRTQAHQERNFQRKVNYYLGLGYSQEAAEKKPPPSSPFPAPASTSWVLPSTSSTPGSGLWRRNRKTCPPKSGSWNTAGNTASSSATQKTKSTSPASSMNLGTTATWARNLPKNYTNWA